MNLLSQTFNFQTFFKATVAVKGSLKHDISFRRRKTLARRAAKINNPFYYSLLDKKLKRFFKRKRFFLKSKRTFRFKNRSRFGKRPFNLKSQLPVFNLRSRRLFRKFSFFLKTDFFRNSAKKPIRKRMLSPYWKRWQVFFWKKYKRTFDGFGLKMLSVMRKYFRAVEPSSTRSKMLTNFMKSFTLATPCLFDYLSVLWPAAPYSFFYYLLSLNFCTINNTPITNPFYPITPNMVLRFNIPPLSFFVLSLSAFRFLKGSRAFYGSISSIKRFVPSGIFETNFNTLEFLVLPNTDNFLTLQTFISYRLNKKITFYQRFYSKQKNSA